MIGCALKLDLGAPETRRRDQYGHLSPAGSRFTAVRCQGSTAPRAKPVSSSPPDGCTTNAGCCYSPAAVLSITFPPGFPDALGKSRVQRMSSPFLFTDATSSGGSFSKKSSVRVTNGDGQEPTGGAAGVAAGAPRTSAVTTAPVAKSVRWGTRTSSGLGAGRSTLRPPRAHCHSSRRRDLDHSYVSRPVFPGARSPLGGPVAFTEVRGLAQRPRKPPVR